MRYTLIEMVQDILSDMDSDLVNSIDDTPESAQVAQILRTTYNDIVSDMKWDHLKTLDQFNSAVAATPTHCKIDNSVKELIEVRYNISDTDRIEYKKMTYMLPYEFLDMVNSRDSTQDNVQSVVDPSGVTLNIINDKPPTYWTSFNDDVLVFDSYDSAEDTFLQNSKSSILVEKEPEWTHLDTFIPDLPSDAFSYLLNEAKSRAFLVLAQEVNQKAEQQSSRARITMSMSQFKNKGGITLPNYGRGTRK